jgi:hypothetical protein
VAGDYADSLKTQELKMMKLLTLLMLIALGLNKPAYSQTSGTETGSPAGLQANGLRPSVTSATVSQPLPGETTGSIAASADTVVTATLRAPMYSKAIQGWNVPLGQRERSLGSVINRFIIHHTTNTGDESPYFKRKNERSSCPTWYVTSSGDVIEFIDPVKRPSSTGKANDYSVAVETQNTSRAPDWGISEASHESIAQIAAWLSKQSKIGPYEVDIKLTRTHIIGHNEAGVSRTACPGPSMRLDWIVERAKQIAAETEKEAAP